MNPSVYAHIVCMIILSAFVVRLSFARASYVDTSALLAGILLLVWAVVIVCAERQQNYYVVPVTDTYFRSDLPPFNEWTWQHRLVARVAYDFFAAGWTTLLLRRLKQVRRGWTELQVTQRARGERLVLGLVLGWGRGHGPSARSLAAWMGLLMALLALLDSTTGSIGWLILFGGAAFSLLIALADVRLYLATRTSAHGLTVAPSLSSIPGSSSGSGTTSASVIGPCTETGHGISITISHAYPPSPSLPLIEEGSRASVIVADLISSLAFLSLVVDTATHGRLFLDIQTAVDAAFVLGLTALLAAPLMDDGGAVRAVRDLQAGGTGLMCSNAPPSASPTLSLLSSIAEDESSDSGDPALGQAKQPKV